MEINKVEIKNYFSTSHSKTISQSLISRFYESSLEGNSCSNSSKCCCISSLLKRIGALIAYPFVKLYEFLTCRVNRESEKEGTSADKSKDISPLSSSSNSKKEKLYYEDPEYFEPERFTVEFFYNSGKSGISNYEQLYQAIPDEAGRFAAAHALGFYQDLVTAWNRGIAFYRGQNNIALPTRWENIDIYTQEYLRGQEAAKSDSGK